MNLLITVESSQFITLIVLVALAAAVLVAVAMMGIFIAFLRKHPGTQAQAPAEEPAEEPAPAEQAEPAEEPAEVPAEEPAPLAEEVAATAAAEVPAEPAEPAEVAPAVAVDAETFASVRYDRSFTAKLIQSTDAVKQWYYSVKRGALSFKKARSRISWRADSINSGRTKLAKFVFRGKTLCLFLALDPDDYADTKYKVERADGKYYEATPCMYRLKNGRRARYALDLIAAVGEKYALTPRALAEEEAYLPYEKDEPLIARGLIKLFVRRFQKPEEPAPAEEPVPVEEPVPAEEPAEEPALVEEAEIEALTDEEKNDVESYNEAPQEYDAEGIPVVGVMFRHRGRKVYWFDPDGKEWTKGEVALYKSPDDPPQEVIVVDVTRRAPSKLHLPLKSLCKVERRK